MPPTSKSINAHLQSLLPRYTASTLPPALVELTASLCATSRARAPHLRGDEEVAREYICGCIAIDRLKVRLNLPDAELKPPVPPRTFDRLLRLFEQLMPMPTSSAGMTAAVLRRDGPSAAGAAGAKARVSRSSLAPGQKRRADGSMVEGEAGEGAAGAASGAASEAGVSGGGVDGWLSEYLTDVERAIDGPPGFADATVKGVQAVFPEYGVVPLPGQTPVPSKRDAALQERLSKTVVAVALVVLPKLGREVTVRETTRVAVKELIVRRMVAMTQFGRMLAESEALFADKRAAWMAMDWWIGLHPIERRPSPPTPAAATEDLPGSSANEDDQAHAPDSSNSAAEAPTTAVEAGQDAVEEDMDDAHEPPLRDLPRAIAGSMLNARVDWLSPERRQDYARWKAATLRRIEALERQQAVAA